MAFDPDVYLAQKTQSTGFDPDAYLAQKTGNQDAQSRLEESLFPGQKFLAGIGKGFVDIGRGVGEKLGAVTPEEIAQSREIDKPLMQSGQGIAGNIIGTIAAALPAMAIPGAGTAAGAAALGAGLGAIQPTVKGESSLANAALGAAMGGAGAILPRVAARVINPEAVQAVKESLGNLTPGQALGGAFKTAEEKATSLPFAGPIIAGAQRKSLESWNNGILNKVLEPIGETTDKVGYEGIKNVGDLISGSYQSLLPKLKVQADPEFAQQVSGLKDLASNLPADKADQLNRIIDSKVMSKFTDSGLMSGETMKQVDSELGRMIRGYKSSQNFDDRQLGDALLETQSALRSMVERNNPDKAGELSNINNAFAQFMRVERAASGVGAKEGIFTPAQLNNAAKATDSSLRKRNFSRGEAMMQDVAQQAEQTIGSKYPDSGTAGRLGQIGALGAYVYNPLLVSGEAGLAGLYGTQAGRNALMALISKRPQMAGPIAEQLRLSSPAAGRIGAIGGAAYLGQQ